MTTDKLVDFDHVTDYISREAAMSMPLANGQYDHENANEHFIYGCESYKEWLEQIPTADVRPVVRGEWKKAYADHEAFGVRPFYRYCSKCNEASVYQYNFCPNCGADMRERES